MNPNPLLKKLGLSNDDRAVILHADDIGMCQASIDAYADLVDFGLDLFGGHDGSLRLVPSNGYLLPRASGDGRYGRPRHPQQ